ncbi:MAG: hypothetical protein JSW47_08565 [Phycisphaerales bacterium]|nr:MAG: hypothetical protein JSW47_08565 [Phycisphaerales bacterium]
MTVDCLSSGAFVMFEDKVLIWRFNHGQPEVVHRIYDKYKADLLTFDDCRACPYLPLGGGGCPIIDAVTSLAAGSAKYARPSKFRFRRREGIDYRLRRLFALGHCRALYCGVARRNECY